MSHFRVCIGVVPTNNFLKKISSLKFRPSNIDATLKYYVPRIVISVDKRDENFGKYVQNGFLNINISVGIFWILLLNKGLKQS